MGLFSESVEVTCSADGQPVHVQWAGRSYIVCAESVRWYERRSWWAEESRAPLGTGPGLVDHEIWRLQVQPEPQQGRREPPAEEPLTLDLTRNAGNGRWRLLRLHDALHTEPADPDSPHPRTA